MSKLVFLNIDETHSYLWNLMCILQVLQQAGAIQPILTIMQEHRTEVLRERAMWMVERLLRNGDLARPILGDPNVQAGIVDAFRYGNNSTRQLAEKSLKHLNKIPTASGVFQKV
jgi:hypothetical protein